MTELPGTTQHLRKMPPGLDFWGCDLQIRSSHFLQEATQCQN